MYIRLDLSPLSYLNDSISTFIEQDIARSGGVTKISQFLTVTRLLAARVGNILSRDSFANDAGVVSRAVRERGEHAYHSLASRFFRESQRAAAQSTEGIVFRHEACLTLAEASLGRVACGFAVGGCGNLVVAEVLKVRAHTYSSLVLPYPRRR